MQDRASPWVFSSTYPQGGNNLSPSGIPGKDGGLAYLLKHGEKCALYFPIARAQIQLVIEDLLKHGPNASTPKPGPGVPVLSRGMSMTLEETYDSLAMMQVHKR